MRDLPELSPAERVAVRSLTRQRAETLFAYDRQIGRLVRTLKSTGEYRNTVLMFTSDNGYFLGEHRMRQGKIKAHEPSLRVPFLVAGPGIPHGDRFDPITTDDVTATILDIARARPPHPPDGRSVVPSFQADRGWRVPVLTEGVESSSAFDDRSAGEALGFGDTRTTIGIRTSRWKYIRYVNGDGELYDLDRDPNEQQQRLRAAEVRRGAVAAAPALGDLQGLCGGVLPQADAAGAPAWARPATRPARSGRPGGSRGASATCAERVRRRRPVERLRPVELVETPPPGGHVAGHRRRGGDVERVHPLLISMTARRSAARSQRVDRPCPSLPRTSATRSRPATASSMSTASSARVSATVVNPAAETRGRTSYQSSKRA